VVTVVSLETALNVHIPISTCSLCKTRSHVSPVSIGLFPSTLLQALDLSTAPHNSSLIWFDMQLLDMIVTLQARQFTAPPAHLTFSQSPQSDPPPNDLPVPQRAPRVLIALAFVQQRFARQVLTPCWIAHLLPQAGPVVTRNPRALNRTCGVPSLRRIDVRRRGFVRASRSRSSHPARAGAQLSISRRAGDQGEAA
jgi:hypothetical protein